MAEEMVRLGWSKERVGVKRPIEHPTSNIQAPKKIQKGSTSEMRASELGVGCWISLDLGASMFVNKSV